MSRMYFYIKILKKQYIWSNNLDLRILNFPHMFVYWNHLFMVSNKLCGHSLNVLTQALLQFRFYRNKDDIFLFIYNNATNILLAYVDDLIITGNNDNLLQNVIQQLNSTFALTDLGNYNTFLVKFVHSKKVSSFHKWSTSMICLSKLICTNAHPLPLQCHSKIQLPNDNDLKDAIE